MRASTEEFLYIMLWSAESLIRPDWRNLNGSFDDWAWRKGLTRRLVQLERQRLLERAPGEYGKFIIRLTESGRLRAIGGRDPQQWWARAWDGRWRMVIFDLPEHDKGTRLRLWRYLRQEGYGFLQNSVWITPDPIEASVIIAKAGIPNLECVVLMEGEPCGKIPPSRIVSAAWDFDEINRRYSRCSALLDAPPGPTDLGALKQWAANERIAWNDALAIDPLLPESLLPTNYRGKSVWKKRIGVVRKLGRFR